MPGVDLPPTSGVCAHAGEMSRGERGLLGSPWGGVETPHNSIALGRQSPIANRQSTSTALDGSVSVSHRGANGVAKPGSGLPVGLASACLVGLPGPGGSSTRPRADTDPQRAFDTVARHDAAARIQAAARGFQARQDTLWRLPTTPPAPEPDGACMGCGARGRAGGACLHCGAPFAPDDDSYHYRFGEWREGPDPHAHHITGRAQDQAQSASPVAGSAAVTGPGDQHGAAARIQAALRGWRGRRLATWRAQLIAAFLMAPGPGGAIALLAGPVPSQLACTTPAHAEPAPSAPGSLAQPACSAQAEPAPSAPGSLAQPACSALADAEPAPSAPGSLAGRYGASEHRGTTSPPDSPCVICGSAECSCPGPLGVDGPATSPRRSAALHSHEEEPRLKRARANGPSGV